jgi:inhibitor of cysteine peptidase
MNKKILLLGLAILIVVFVAGCFSILPTTGLALVDEIDILILESFPVQVHVIASGNLPDPCTEISEISQEREGNTFIVTIKTYRPPAFGIQVLAPFEEIIPLEVYGLPAGTYTVDVNGVQDTFDLEVDNILLKE